MVEFYVAYSKTGTYQYITANIEQNIKRPRLREKVQVTGLTFTVTEPRYGSSLRNGVKLLSNEISQASTPKQVLDFFLKLRDLGWDLDQMEEFCRRHKMKVPPTPVTTTPAAADNSGADNSGADNSDTNTASDNAPVPAPTVPVADNDAAPATAAPPTTETTTASTLTLGQQIVLQIVQDMTKQNIPATVPEIQTKFNDRSTDGTRYAPSDVRRVLNSLQRRGLVQAQVDNLSYLAKAG